MKDVAKLGESEGHIEKIVQTVANEARDYDRGGEYSVYQLALEEAVEALNQLIREETRKAQIETALDLHVLAQLSDKETFLEQVEKRIAELRGEPVQNRTWSNAEGKFL